jgi:multiple sugar transport system substrate-binding protein
MANLADEVQGVERLVRDFKKNHIDRREFMMLATAFSATAIAAACSTGGGSSSTTSSGPSDKTKTVPLYTNQNDPASLAFFGAVALAYQKTHPNVQIPVNLYDDGTAVQFLTTSFQTGHDVGIFTPPPSFVNAWVKAKLLLEIDDTVSSIGKDEFLPGTRFIINGHDYSIPYQVNQSGLWYRTDLFQAAGIKAPLATYDDLISALKELHGRNGKIGIASGVGGDVPDVSLHCMTPYILQSGWGYFDKNGKLTFNRDEVFAGVQRFLGVLKYTDKSMYNATYGDLVTAYVSGRAAMVHYPGRVGNNVAASAPAIEAVTDFMPEPGGPFMTGKLNFGTPRGWSIYAKTAHPTEAKDFLKFMMTGQNLVDWALTVPGQILPGLKSALAMFNDPNNKSVAANKYMAKHAAWVRKIEDLVPFTVNEEIGMGGVSNNHYQFASNPNPFGDKIWKNPAIDAVMIQQVVLQARDPSAAWKDATNQMDQASKDFFAKNPSWKPAG